ncbi:MAG: sugar ABC transporter permease [Defluviitaleaceae bacterium]|nr:sugar ABC transporter permease [Defluviitaleaceae bacterium]MCL2276057.1 sugar ABC transporter permease [Defluviitaleaceae bacterium]
MYKRGAILFLLPSLLGLAVFFIVPFGISVYFSLIDNAVSRQFVGLGNFIDTWNNQAFELAVRNTLVFMGVSIPLNMLIALTLALCLKPMRVAIRRVLMVFFLMPLVIPSGSVVFFWRHFVAFNGMLNRLILTYVPEAWIGTEWMPTGGWLNSDIAMYFVVGIFIWKNVGFNMILFQAGLDFIPKEYYEVASIEGAGRWRQFFSVTLVYLAPTFLLVFILSVVNSFKVFREIYLLTGTHPNPSIYLLQHFLNNQFAMLNYQRMASASVFVFGFVLVLVFILYRLQQRQSYI